MILNVFLEIFSNTSFWWKKHFYLRIQYNLSALEHLLLPGRRLFFIYSRTPRLSRANTVSNNYILPSLVTFTFSLFLRFFLEIGKPKEKFYIVPPRKMERTIET